MGSSASKIANAGKNSFPAIYPGLPQSVAIGAGSLSSTAFQTDQISEMSVVRLSPTIDCFISFGSTPTASSSTIFLPAGCIEYFSVPAVGLKVAVIRANSGETGTLYICEGI